mmetsp:Transcript_44162/g.101989  ORF Transcript_44162/g.101989 Transcript_44162/m.101989 type:complete len:283 (-) Transcript_44162:19-867(-)
MSWMPSTRPLRGMSLTINLDVAPMTVDIKSFPFVCHPEYVATTLDVADALLPLPPCSTLKARPDSKTVASSGTEPTSAGASGGFSCLTMSYRDTSKTTSPAGLLPSGSSPNASFDGIQNLRVSPGDMSFMPSCHPGKRSSTRSVILSSRLESNILPVDTCQPEKSMTTLSYLVGRGHLAISSGGVNFESAHVGLKSIFDFKPPLLTSTSGGGLAASAGAGGSKKLKSKNPSAWTSLSFSNSAGLSPPAAAAAFDSMCLRPLCALKSFKSAFPAGSQETPGQL